MKETISKGFSLKRFIPQFSELGDLELILLPGGVD